MRTRLHTVSSGEGAEVQAPQGKAAAHKRPLVRSAQKSSCQETGRAPSPTDQLNHILAGITQPSPAARRQVSGWRPSGPPGGLPTKDRRQVALDAVLEAPECLQGRSSPAIWTLCTDLAGAAWPEPRGPDSCLAATSAETACVCPGPRAPTCSEPGWPGSTAGYCSQHEVFPVGLGA